MRCGPLLVILALLVGAGPALAQANNSASGIPYPMEPVAKHKAKSTVKRAARKHHEHPAATKEASKAASKTPSKTPAKTAKKFEAKPAASSQTTKQATVKRAVAKPAASNVPLPRAVPRAVLAKAAPIKPAPATTKHEPAEIRTAKTDAADAVVKSAAAKPASDAFTGIPPADRLKIQQELFWSGDYSGAVSGEDPMQAAIKKFQKRSRAKITGALTDRQRAELVAAADRHQQEFGWRVVVDPATGIRIGLPTRLVPDAHAAAHGTRWSSPHGAVQVETFRFNHANLAALFEQEKKHPADRKVERSVLNGDNFFISGTQGLKNFSVRAKARDSEVRGFTLLYDQMMEGIVAPAMVAMASAFSPFPEHLAPFAVLDNQVEYGTGLIVGTDGHIVTALKVAQGCQVIVADGLGNAERVAEDPQHGLALLRVYGAVKRPVLALPRAAPKEGDTAGNIALIGIPDPKEQDGGNKLTAIKARLADSDAIQFDRPVPVAGFSGAAALDAHGRFLGMMETRSYVLASVDAGVPPVRLISAATIRDFLARNHVAADGTADDARAAAIRIICVRK
jgi:Trypsin-like peptidase domain